MALTKSHTSGTPLGSNREDLSDVLTILEPERTPLLSLAKKGKANGTFFEWQTDSLSTPAFGGELEGADVTSFTNQVANRATLGNHVQVFRQNYQVSNIQE